jgi:site-specific recombinase XerD
MGKVTALHKEAVTWEEALQDFLFFKKAQRVSKTTLDDYRQHVRRFFRRYPDAWQSRTLKRSVMEYMSDNIKPATFNLRLTYLRGFFQWCVREGELPDNPLRGFKKQKAQARIVDVSEETVKNLLKLPNQSTFAGLRDYALILFTLDTGIRPKEARSLIPGNFDLRRLLVTVPEEEDKTRQGRGLPIMPQTAEAIRRLIRARHSDWDKSVPVFCSSEGTKLSRFTWRDRMDLYSEKLGFKVRPYDLRHTFALMFLRNGGHAFALQRSLGHSDMNMTKRYVHLTGNDLKDVHQTASPLNSILPSKKKRVRKVKSHA